MSGELDTITHLLADLNEEPLLPLIRRRLLAGDDPLAIVEACRKGMAIAGERFAAREYFVSDLVVSAEIFNNIMKLIGPGMLASSQSQGSIKVVLGTVMGDIHDIGKNLVAAMLRCHGCEVYDIGINVPPQIFVDKVKQTGATIVGLSGLLTIAFPSMENTIQALAAAGLRDKVKVIIGGGLVDDFVCRHVGADGWGHDAMEAVKLTRTLAGGGMT